MELFDLFTETAEVRAEYKGRTFVLQAYTEKLTPEYRAKALLMAAAGDGEEAQAEFKDEGCQMLADLIASWKDGDGEEIVVKGEVFPPTYENLLRLSYPLIATLTRNITTYLGELANPQKETN